MKTIVALLGVLIAGAIADVHAEEAEKAPAPRPGIANCEVFRPSGDYALLQLALTIPGDPKNTDRSNRVNQIWTYVGGVRGGKNARRRWDRHLVNQDNGTGMKGDPLKPAIAAYRLGLTRPEPLWELGPDENTARVAALRDSNNAKYGPVHNECVPLVVRGKYLFTADLRVANIETGRVVATTDGVAPANGGSMQAIEDLVLVRRDGTHGNMECGF